MLSVHHIFDIKLRSVDVVPYLGNIELCFVGMCCSAARELVTHIRHDWNTKLNTFNISDLKAELEQIWQLHKDLIQARSGRLNKNESASDVYDCWPSMSWFKKASLPFHDRLHFECGDSSYNIWIFELPDAMPLLGRIICDLYLRLTWPKTGIQAETLDEFTKAAADAASHDSYGGTWEFGSKDTYELMNMIWWRDTLPLLLASNRAVEFQRILQKRPYLRAGALVPRRPQPEQGLCLLSGQESIFLTCDSLELWVYCCYVD